MARGDVSARGLCSSSLAALRCELAIGSNTVPEGCLHDTRRYQEPSGKNRLPVYKKAIPIGKKHVRDQKMDKLVPTEKSLQRDYCGKRNNPEDSQKVIYKCQRQKEK